MYKTVLLFTFLVWESVVFAGVATYDKKSYVQEIHHNSGLVISYTYDNAGNITEIHSSDTGHAAPAPELEDESGALPENTPINTSSGGGGGGAVAGLLFLLGLPRSKYLLRVFKT